MLLPSKRWSRDKERRLEPIKLARQRAEPASPDAELWIRSYQCQNPMPPAPEIKCSHFGRLLEQSAALQVHQRLPVRTGAALRADNYLTCV